MKKILTIISIIGLLGVFAGCGRRTDEGKYWSAPNWTSDGKIVFLEHYCIQKWEQTISGWTQAGGSEEINLYEIDNNGSGLRKITEIDSNEFGHGPELGGISTSSAGNWIVLSIEDWRRGEHYPVIYTVKRNGDSLMEIGSGTYPDFSPDASKIVYEKPNQGIWIMNKDGSNDHQIVKNLEANRPAWSTDGEKIGYIRSDSLGIWVVDTSGNLIYSWKGDSVVKPGGPGGIDWGPPDSNAIIAECGRISPEYEDGFIVLYLDSLQKKYVFTPLKACVYRWSPDGRHFKAQDSEGNFITTFGNNYSVNFATKWYLKP